MKNTGKRKSNPDRQIPERAELSKTSQATELYHISSETRVENALGKENKR